MARFDKDETVRRVAEKMKTGDYFFPEDLAVSVAEHLGVDIVGTPFEKTTESPTAGSVPPFSGVSVKAAKAQQEQYDKNMGNDNAEATDEEVDEDSYSSWTVDELQDELRKRDLPVSGNKAELVERLEGNDEEGGE